MRPARAPLRAKWQARARGYARAGAEAGWRAAWRKLIEAGETSTVETPARPGPCARTPRGDGGRRTAQCPSAGARERIFPHHAQLGPSARTQRATPIPGGRRAAQGAGRPLDTVLQYALGANWALASAALAALKQRADGGQVVDDIVAPLRQALSLADVLRARVLRRRRNRGRRSVRRWSAPRTGGATMSSSRCCFATTSPRASAWATRRFLETPRRRLRQLRTVKALLERVSHPYAKALINHLHSLQQTTIDRTFLTSFGRFWKDGKDTQALVEPEPWREGLTAAEAISLEAPARSLLVSGEHRVGKTSFLRLLAKAPGSPRLDRVRGQRRRSDGRPEMVRRARGSHPASASRAGRDEESHLVHPRHPADRAERHASGPGRQHPRPDPAGDHRGASGDVDGSLVSAAPRGCCACGRRLRSALEVARLEPLSQEETQELARALLQPLSDASGLEIDPACVETALGTARQYLSAGLFRGRCSI